MLKLIKKNNLTLNKHTLNSLNFFICKILFFDKTIIFFLNREKIRKFFNKFSRLSSLTYFQKTCVLTGRSRGNWSLFRLSRIKIKDLAWEGLLVGLRRASW